MRHLLFLLCLSVPSPLLAQPRLSQPQAMPPILEQPPHAPPKRLIGLRVFLAQVGRANLQLAAQRADVSAAQAQIAVARVFIEPVVSGGILAFDPGGKQTLGLGLNIAQTLETGGKRKARIVAAETALDGAQASLDNVLRNLRAEASIAFMEALRTQLALQRKRQTLINLERLVAVNTQRHEAGDIGAVPLVQSRVEAARFRGELLAAQAQQRAAELRLYVYAGDVPADDGPGFQADGDLAMPARDTSHEAQWVSQALACRPDVIAQRSAVRAAQVQLKLAGANRWEDVTLAAGWQHNLASTDLTYAQPSHLLSATASVPLPLARIYHGELDVARAGVVQAQASLAQAELEAGVSVRQALTLYRAALERLRLYQGGVVEDANTVFKATLYSYQRGSATLLELLNAQRTDNEVVLAHIDALADHAKALIAIDQAMGCTGSALY